MRSRLLLKGKVVVMLLLIALLTSGILGGCGQKGPLYLPQKQEQAKKSQSEDD